MTRRRTPACPRTDVRLGPAQRLDVVVDRDREHLGLARDVAADHQHHAELAHRVGEAEDRPGQEAGPRQRHRHGQERVPRRGAQRRRDLERPVAERLEGVADRLHHEGHRIDHRPDHQALESEGERAAAAEAARSSRPGRSARARSAGRSRARSAAGRAAAPPRRHGLLPPRRRPRQPPRDRRAHDQEDDGGYGGELDGQENRLPQFDSFEHRAGQLDSPVPQDVAMIVTASAASPSAPVRAAHGTGGRPQACRTPGLSPLRLRRARGVEAGRQRQNRDLVRAGVRSPVEQLRHHHELRPVGRPADRDVRGTGQVGPTAARLERQRRCGLARTVDVDLVGRRP